MGLPVTEVPARVPPLPDAAGVASSRLSCSDSLSAGHVIPPTRHRPRGESRRRRTAWGNVLGRTYNAFVGNDFIRAPGNVGKPMWWDERTAASPASCQLLHP